MAAEQGGNCELTVPDRGRGPARRDHRRLHGPRQPAGETVEQRCYANNLFRLTEELCKTKDGVIDVNMDDDAIRGLTVVKDGVITWPAPPLKLAAPPPKPSAALRSSPQAKGHGHGASEPMSAKSLAIVFGAGALLFLLVGLYAPATFLVALHGVRSRLFHRLHGGLERDTVAAHAAHERDERHLVDHRDRRARPGGAAA